uniref:hypothetical protein n=1 Tax=Ornithobacterium rhinotracheale TaxID=28251 RepID=UPI00129CF1AC|nr:hypothetical protein [Ornithobacterium rhinotracheale]
MKRNLFLAAMLSLGSIAFAQQQGKVGVNTNNPTESFHVEGTARVKTLPAAGGAITTNSSGNFQTGQTFAPTKMVVTDENGVLGSAPLPAGAKWTLKDKITINTSRAAAYVNLDDYGFKDLYVIDDTTTSGGLNTYITLPTNETNTETARVVRIYIAATAGSPSGGLYISEVGNPLLRGKITNNNGKRSVLIGNNSGLRFYTLLTFVEVNGKWYFDTTAY